MEELLRTNDPVLISFVTSLFDQADVTFLVLDTHMSVLEGSLGAIPQRILVASDELAQARRLLRDAGLEAELKPA